MSMWATRKLNWLFQSLGKTWKTEMLDIFKEKVFLKGGCKLTQSSK